MIRTTIPVEFAASTIHIITLLDFISEVHFIGTTTILGIHGVMILGITTRTVRGIHLGAGIHLIITRIGVATTAFITDTALTATIHGAITMAGTTDHTGEEQVMPMAETIIMDHDVLNVQILITDQEVPPQEAALPRTTNRPMEQFAPTKAAEHNRLVGEA